MCTTSTATVGVMPEYEDVDIEIEDKDLRVDFTVHQVPVDSTSTRRHQPFV